APRKRGEGGARVSGRVRGNQTLTPGAQVAAATDLLAVIDTGERPADDVAADYFRRRRYIGAKDRAHIAGHVYAVLRHRTSLDWWICKHPVNAAPRSRVLAALMLIEGWRPEAIQSCCDGDRFRPAPLSEAEERPVRGLAGFKEGLVEVQDEGSHIAALPADARPGMRVVDFCAGAGGKALALAAGMGNRGKLVACDVTARRLERAARRLRRAGVNNAER